MRVIEPGHRYALRCLDTPIKALQEQALQFVKRVGDKYPGNSRPPLPGTTLQEVLRACLDRIEYLNGQQPCGENIVIREALLDALITLERRAHRVHGGPWIPSDRILAAPVCLGCLHTFCTWCPPGTPTATLESGRQFV